MMIGQADHARAQLNVPSAVRGNANENFRAGDGFPAGTVVLTDPHLIEPQGIQPLYELQVALEGQSGILVDAMERGHEDTKLQSFGKSHVCSHSLQQAMVVSSSNARIIGVGGMWVKLHSCRAASQ